jgi:signal transduction histidine kinase
MPRLRLGLLLACLTLGAAAELAAYDTLGAGLAGADLAVGWVLLVCGFIAWTRRPASRVGLLMIGGGGTWFLGTLFEPALFLHRGPLVQLHLSYPTGRLPTRLVQAVVALAYITAIVEPLARNDGLTLALSGLVAFAAVQVFLGTSGAARKAGGPALAAALAFAAVLALGAFGRLFGWSTDAVLLTYDAVIACVVVGLLVDLLRGRWSEAVVTGLVVDLGAPAAGASLRGKLAHALGDPSLVLGYRLPEAEAFVDESGRPVELPEHGSGRAVTVVDDYGEQVAVLIHDDGLLADRPLLDSVAAAARIAVANARLQAEARAHAEELDASRRRIVVAGDTQRRRLEEELRLGAERRLDSVAALLATARTTVATTDPGIEALEADLDAARRELREFAQGVHPAALSEEGLMPALARLAERSPISVEVDGTVGRLPAPIEATLYFVCSEALANATKHSAASRVSIEFREEHGRVVVAVVDDGLGGADLGAGFGLRSLADRVEAHGGRLSIESPRGSGTRVTASISVERPAATGDQAQPSVR